MPKKPRPRSAPKKKSGLNSKEKSQVTQLAKAAVLTVAEKKYMRTQPTFGATPNVSKATSKVSVMAFVNTTNVVGTGLSSKELNYGVEDQSSTADPVPFRELLMLRPFTSTTGNQQTDNYAIEGRECMPVSAQTKWRLSRDIGKITSGIETAAWNTNIGAPNGLNHNLPIICRMIRVNPKQLQTNVECDPEQDLFVSEFNNAIGVSTSSFDDLELLTYRINRRRYDVIEDKFFRIQNGLTVSYQRGLHHDGTTGAMLQPFISNTNANCEKVMTTSHRLTSKKMSPIFYDVPDGTPLNTATAGAKTEYIMYHFIYAGAETYLDNVGVVDKSPTDLKVSAISTVKFTDS